MKTGFRLLSLALIIVLNCMGAVVIGDTVKKVGVAWESKSPIADHVLTGFQAAMKELAPTIEIEVQGNLKDIGALSEVVQRFEKEKNAVVLLRSTGAKYYIQKKLTIPGFFGGCDDPVSLGVLKNDKAPEGNCTGVTYAVPYLNQLETFQKIAPNVKSVLLLLQEGHPTTPLLQTGTKTACDQLKIKYTEKFCKTKEDALMAVKEADAPGLAVVCGTQVLLLDNAALIANAIKSPVLGYSEKLVLDGALCGLVADDNKLGGMLAESVIDVLIRGKAIKDVPVKTDPDPQLIINGECVKRLNLEIPFDLLQSAKIIEKK